MSKPLTQQKQAPAKLYEPIEGKYECYLYKENEQNGYHFVTITPSSNGCYIWSNLCTKWTLTPTNKPFIFHVSDECPYFKTYKLMSFKTEQNMIIAAYGPHNELYQKVRKFSDNIYNMKEIKSIKLNKKKNNEKINKEDIIVICPDEIEVKEDIIETEGCEQETNDGKGTSDTCNNNEIVIEKECIKMEDKKDKCELFWKGGKPKKNQCIGRVNISENFGIEFQMYIHGKVTENCFENILHIGNKDIERCPGIWFCPKNYKLYISLSIIENHDKHFETINLEKDNNYKIKIYSINNCLKVIINNNVCINQKNMFHLTKYRAPVWIGDPWYPSANVTVMNLKIFNPK